jgi:uncharacterized protein YjbI with pentapeptide repeats
MADQSHLDILRQGVEVWNSWKGGSAIDVVPDLSEVKLSEAELDGVDLRRTNLSGAEFFRAKLSGAHLPEADLSWANLSGAFLAGANLAGADLSGALFPAADLSGADLSGADLSGAAFLTQKQLDETKLGDNETQLPPDLKPPAHWNVRTDEQIEES